MFGRNIRKNSLGNVWITLALAIVGLGLIIAGIVFYVYGHAAWATPVAEMLIGFAVLCVAGFATVKNAIIAYLAVILALVGVVILIGHYANFF